MCRKGLVELLSQTVTFVANLDYFKAHLDQRERVVVHSRTSAQIAKHHDKSGLFVFLFEPGQRENEHDQKPDADGGQLGQEVGLLEEKKRREHV